MIDNSKMMPEEPKKILQTSVQTDYTPHPNEVTVEFRRWTQVGMTAYQRGQRCGLLRHIAEPLVRQGRCLIVG